jgi:hypothetical protein
MIVIERLHTVKQVGVMVGQEVLIENDPKLSFPFGHEERIAAENASGKLVVIRCAVPPAPTFTA